MNRKSSLNRYFTIIKSILALTPLLCLIYLSMAGQSHSLTITEMISSDPSITLMFLVAMLNPFAAYLLGFVQKKIEEGDYAYAVLNLIGLLLIELMMLNLVYVMFMGFLLAKVKKNAGLSIIHELKIYKNGKFLTAVSGCLVIFPIAALCLFAQIRLGLY